MSQAGQQPQPGLPPDPVRAALELPEVRDRLFNQAQASMGRWSNRPPAAVRSEAAAEAVQETELRALQRRQNYCPSTGSVCAWLHGIMNNVLREFARRRGRQRARDPADPDAWKQLADRIAAADYLAWLLARLPADQREVLRLRFVEGLSHRDIAARLGISSANARVRVCRALAAARVIA